jgi:hypothetical protein
MIVEQLVEWRLAGETDVLGENLPQRHFVHHKSHMTRPGLEPWAATVGSLWLTVWAVARPYFICLNVLDYWYEDIILRLITMYNPEIIFLLCFFKYSL